MTLAEIRQELDHISETWRDGTDDEQRAQLAQLDDALAELDDIDAETRAAADAIEELRGRIEILMDEIEISLGMEPAPIEWPIEPGTIADDVDVVEFEGEEEPVDHPG